MSASWYVFFSVWRDYPIGIVLAAPTWVDFPLLITLGVESAIEFDD